MADLALVKAREALHAGRLRDAKEAILGAAIAADKAELLDGRATSRSESFAVHGDVDDVRAQIAALEAELGSS